MCNQIQYQKYKPESKLINFLIDDKEPPDETGMAMAAGLSELSEIQNSVLNQLVEIYSSDKGINKELIFELESYPVQRLKKEHILDIKLDDPDTMRYCTMNNLKYG
jgi:hypothetical protein